MKKIKYLIIMLSIFFALPNIAHATEYYECSVTNLTKLQRLASNIVASYDYIETKNQNDQYNSLVFNVKLNNLNNKFYIINEETGTRYNYTSDEIVIPNLNPSQTLHYKVYANDYACNDKYLITVYVSLPAFNKYYTDDLCKNHQGYKLCNRWSKVDLSYDKFKQAVKKYDNKQEIVEEPIKKHNSIEQVFANIINYLDENRIIIFGAVIGISFIWIIILLIKKRQNEFKLK